jgi:hypothetical protein
MAFTAEMLADEGCKSVNVEESGCQKAACISPENVVAVPANSVAVAAFAFEFK